MWNGVRSWVIDRRKKGGGGGREKVREERGHRGSELK